MAVICEVGAEGFADVECTHTAKFSIKVAANDGKGVTFISLCYGHKNQLVETLNMLGVNVPVFDVNERGTIDDKILRGFESVNQRGPLFNG